jgi:hypothetical protein
VRCSGEDARCAGQMLGSQESCLSGLIRGQVQFRGDETERGTKHAR